MNFARYLFLEAVEQQGPLCLNESERISNYTIFYGVWVGLVPTVRWMTLPRRTFTIVKKKNFVTEVVKLELQ